MTQQSEYEDKGRFVQYQHYLIYGCPELSRDDKWVLLAIMGKCWQDGFHALSYRTIAKLAQISFSTLSSTEKKGEGIIDRLVRFRFIQVKLDKEIDPLTGEKCGNAKTYIRVNYAYLWQLNTAYCSNSKDEPVRTENEPVRQENRFVRTENGSVRQENEPVRGASSKGGGNTRKIEKTGIEDIIDSLLPSGKEEERNNQFSSSQENSSDEDTNPPPQKKPYVFTPLERECIAAWNAAHPAPMTKRQEQKNATCIQELAEIIETSYNGCLDTSYIKPAFDQMGQDEYWQEHVRSLPAFVSKFTDLLEFLYDFSE